MTGEHITVLVAAVAVVAVGAELVAWWHRGRILAEAAEPGTELVPVAAVSTLPVPDVDGWSSQVGWSAWRAWLDVCHAAVFTEEPSIFTDLAAQFALTLAAIEARRPLELTGATT